jgi:hypothetical protein
VGGADVSEGARYEIVVLVRSTEGRGSADRRTADLGGVSDLRVESDIWPPPIVVGDWRPTPDRTPRSDPLP